MNPLLWDIFTKSTPIVDQWNSRTKPCHIIWPEGLGMSHHDELVEKNPPNSQPRKIVWDTYHLPYTPRFSPLLSELLSNTPIFSQEFPPLNKRCKTQVQCHFKLHGEISPLPSIHIVTPGTREFDHTADHFLKSSTTKKMPKRTRPIMGCLPDLYHLSTDSFRIHPQDHPQYPSGQWDMACWNMDHL